MTSGNKKPRRSTMLKTKFFNKSRGKRNKRVSAQIPIISLNFNKTSVGLRRRKRSSKIRGSRASSNSKNSLSKRTRSRQRSRQKSRQKSRQTTESVSSPEESSSSELSLIPSVENASSKETGALPNTPEEMMRKEEVKAKMNLSKINQKSIQLMRIDEERQSLNNSPKHLKAESSKMSVKSPSTTTKGKSYNTKTVKKFINNKKPSVHKKSQKRNQRVSGATSLFNTTALSNHNKLFQKLTSPLFKNEPVAKSIHPKMSFNSSQITPKDSNSTKSPAQKAQKGSKRANSTSKSKFMAKNSPSILIKLQNKPSISTSIHKASQKASRASPEQVLEKSSKAIEQKFEDFGETISRDFSETLLSSMFYLTSRPKVKK